MAKFKLQPEPTFKKAVGIPVPGGKTEPVEFTFKYRDRAELLAFAKRHTPPSDEPEESNLQARMREDVQMILDMASGWELADAFTEETVGQLVANYVGAPSIIFDVYLSEHTKVREKN